MNNHADSPRHPSPRGNRPRHAKRKATPPSPEALRRRDELLSQLELVSLADDYGFRRRLHKARSAAAFDAIANDITRAAEDVELRRLSIPEISFPEQLPVSARKDDIAEAIANHQVVIIAGETGSGKTTQIPKICLELGRGVRGMIGHTQPRRLAARTVAERIAAETETEIGDLVGYAIRFDDVVSKQTAVKIMTDGILLAEMQRDRYLNAYDTIIIDEAHERSLNIDFLLGYLKRLLPKRPDLKVIITSATIDPERFAEHFADSEGNPAPIIEVSGRTYPVEILYRPLQAQVGEKTVDIDPVDGLIDALQELMGYGDGDILCFFAGEADIREAREAIEGQKWRGAEVVPLYGRLSNEEQHKVFRPHSGRRIVLATNIAETSLTVPGIHFVVDTGTARISRYSLKNKVQRLPIEPISQASANQRSGRCGRVADGIAIRLYSEEDFEARPEFTDPEILRTNLASVILQMASLRLGDIDEFPFIQKPDTRSIRDGLLLLHELGALTNSTSENGSPTLTRVGRTLARIPVDPRMARMLVAGQQLGCLGAVYVIVAGLSIQDIRERPLEKQAQADQLHARFRDKTSDFLTYLNLWNYISGERAQLSGNAFKKKMQAEFLHYMRIREWWDLVRQLQNIGDQIGWDKPADDVEKPDEDAIHRSLLSGLLSHIGIRVAESREFQGARNTRFAIFPGSALSKKPPQFIMASALVETSRLWARDVAAIDPRWVEELSQDLLKHQYSEPHWSTKHVNAMCYERATLYGVPIVVDRLIPFHRVEPEDARALFIRHALVQGEWTTHHAFYKKNSEKLAEAEELEAKARRRDLLVDEDSLFDFYDARVPESVYSGVTFDRWWKKASREDATLLDFDPDKLLHDDAQEVTEEQFPSTWYQNSLKLELSYVFEPGAPDDGVTMQVPIPLLAGISEEGCEWLVPGVRLELVTELIRSLPKHIRRSVVPAPNFAERILPSLHPDEGGLLEQIAQRLGEITHITIEPGDFDQTKLPAHLRMRYAAVDRHGKVIDSDRDLDALKRRRAGQIKSSVSRVNRRIEQKETTTWTRDTLGEVKEAIQTTVDGQKVKAYPALVATPNGIAVRAMPTKEEAEASIFSANLTMLLREITVNTQKTLNGLPLKQRVAVENYPHGGPEGLVNDARTAAIRDLMMEHGGPVRTPEEFQSLLSTVRPLVAGRVRQMIVALAPGLVSYFDIQNQLKGWKGAAIDDLNRQLDFLLPEHAVSKHGVTRLKHLPRYLQAMSIRLEEMDRNPGKDQQRQEVVEKLEAQLSQKVSSARKGSIRVSNIRDIQWQLQELRVSLFAQRLGTAQSVSERKIAKAIQSLGA
ncbi:ATP-dependent RNA helicase HrpA [Corynebacterium vitaeruminis]|uniref:ATP-dependent RNA helicase HrpA n=1 Tax=Corynebacterium vitaeruminis TaxID=38305 RepID=UPI0023F20902|nr:ATP-dependent RNA helicase HrpA [Corynebacterium vitaeruminis]